MYTETFKYYQHSTYHPAKKLTWRFDAQNSYGWMYVKIDGTSQWKKNNQIEIRFNDYTPPYSNKNWNRKVLVLFWLFQTPKRYILRISLSPDIHTLSDFTSRNNILILLMTLISFQIDDQIHCIAGLTVFTGAKDFMVTTQMTNSPDQIETFTCSPGSTYYPSFEAKLKNNPPPHMKKQDRNMWMNLVEKSKRHSGDNKENWRVDLNCNWTPMFFQREHTITSSLRIPDASTV